MPIKLIWVRIIRLNLFQKIYLGQDADQQLELLPICVCLQRPEVLAKRKPSGDLDAIYLILKVNFIMEGRS